MQISPFGANELELRDASLHQKQVQLLGDVYTLAVSSLLTLLSSQTNGFFEKKKKKIRKWTGQILGRIIISLTNVGDAYRCQETTTMERSSPNISVTPTLTTPGPAPMGEAPDKRTAESRKLHNRYIGT